MMSKDQTYTFEQAEAQVNEFEALLNRQGINIIPGSALERLALRAKEVLEKRIHPKQRDVDEDMRLLFREMIGFCDLSSKVIAAESHHDFSKLVPHLRKLNLPLQNCPTPSTDQENNKVFELFIAALCMSASADGIELDDPDQSKGDNPDVIAIINRQKWGFGCKALHSNKPKTIFDNIMKAAEQIEDSTSERGLPTINAKNIIDHDSFWPVLETQGQSKSNDPIYGAFPSLGCPKQMMQDFVNQFQQSLAQEIGVDEILRFFSGLKSEAACLMYFPTVTSLATTAGPVSTRLNTMHLIRFNEVSDECFSICRSMNHELQKHL